MLKFKNLLILFALIAALLMPAGAWAYDITQTNIGELQTAIASADEDIVIGGEITLEDVIAISKDVTIRGNGKTITAAAGKRHFNITSGTTTFEGITFDGNNGGGIEITGGSATFSGKTKFSNNKVTGDGGALDIASGATATFEGDATFTNNIATGDGGAINSAGTVTFSKSATFTGNTASSNGGAINSSGTVSFADSATFTGNSATGNGGAINSAGTVEFNSTTAAPKFTGNSAANGGAINITAGTFKLTSTTDEQKFENNSATGSGGALNMAGGELTFPYTASFTSNDAGTSGGAVSVSAGTLGFTGAATFSKNAAASGGAVNTSGGTINFRAAGFNNNTSTGSDNGNGGGAIAISNGTINFTVSPSFESNTAARDGGAIYSNSGTLNFNDDAAMSFTSNKAGNRGGAIYASALPSFKGSVSFNINTAAGNGGAVYISGTNGTAPDFGSGFMFYQNTTTDSSNGGAVYSERTLTLSGASFDANTAAGNGGAVYSAGNVKVESGTFANNTGELSGGVIYSTGTVEITGGDFIDNASNGALAGGYGGGAVYAATIKVTGSSTAPLTFSGQTATGSGGVLFATTSLTASQVIFEGNSAASGGALRVSSGTDLALTNVSFIGNNTTTVTGGADGGAVFSEATTNSIKNCFFSGNLAQIDGGAIALGRDNSTFELEYSYFLNNVAGVASTATHSQGGGAIYLSPVGKATIESCTFNGNSINLADKALGGALFIANSSTSNIQNSTFYNNAAYQATSTNDGGALYVNGTGELTLSFCTFTENLNVGRGGALFVNTGTLKIIGSIVAGNNTNGDIYNAGGTIISAGYNRVGRLSAGSGITSDYINWDSNNVGTNAALDIADNGGSRGWKSSNFFGENTLAVNDSTQRAGAGSDSDYSAIVPTIALDETDPTDTRALDGARNFSTKVVIPNGSYPEYDERHLGTVKRANMGAAPDIGAFERYQSSSGDSDNPYSDYDISSIKISGIPNTLSIVGQTAILHATVTYVNGTTTTTAEPLTWTLKDIEGSNAIRFSDNKNSKTSSSGSVYADGIGVSEITVSARDGVYKDSKKIYVIWHQQDTNIHPNVLNLVNQLNLQLSNDSINFYIMSAGYKDAVSDSSFKSAFKNAWGTEPKVIELNGLSFSSNANFSRAAQSKLDKAYSAGITANINNQETGAVLPVFCIWNFDLNDLDEDFNSNGDAIETMTDSEFSAWLFKNLNIGFEITGGEFLPAVSSSNQSSLQSAAFKDLVTAEDAVNSGALSVQRGENDVTVSMLAYIANVEPKGSTGSKLLTTSGNQKLLVIPGGNSAKNISGTIWTAEAASSSNNNNSNSGSGSSSGKKSGGGGGGGCDALGLNLIALILLALLFNRKHA